MDKSELEKLPKDCGGSQKYRGMRPPRCNEGKGCQACWKVYNERLDSFVELIRRS